MLLLSLRTRDPMLVRHPNPPKMIIIMIKARTVYIQCLTNESDGNNKRRIKLLCRGVKEVFLVFKNP